MPTGQLQLGAVTVRAPGTAEIIGYAFTVAHGQGQLQRWILYRRPGNAFDVTAPSEAMARWTEDDWKAQVPALWRPGSYYVRAQANLYEFGRTYGKTTWDRIPQSFLLPSPVYPPGGDGFQLDHTGKLIKVMVPEQPDLGIVFVAGKLSQASNAEYWLLSGRYVPAGGSARTAIAEGTEVAEDLEAFVAVANRSWAPGAALAITGCKNYHGDEVPGIL